MAKKKNRAKKLRFKVYFDRETERVEYVSFQFKNMEGLVKGLVVEEIGTPMPKMQNPRNTLEEREAELTIFPKDTKKKGQITLTKK